MSAEGRASYAESKAREKASREAGTGYYKSHPASGRGGGSSKPVYFYNPKTKHYTYRVGGGSPGSGWQSVGTTQPAGYTARVTQGTLAGEQAQARIKEIQATGKYYYDPNTMVATTRRVEGQTGMTKREVLSTIKNLPQETKSEYKKSYQEYQTSKTNARLQSNELNLLSGPMPQRQTGEAPSMAEYFAPPRKISGQESQVPSGVKDYSYNKIDYKYKPAEDIKAPPRKISGQESQVPPSIGDYSIKYKPIDVSKIKSVDISPDVSKIESKYGKKVTSWDKFYETEKAIKESNLQLFKQRTIGQTKSAKQMSDIKTYEDVSSRSSEFLVKQTAKPLIIATSTVLGVAALGQAIPAVAATKIPIVSQMAKFSISPVGSKMFTGLWAGSLGYRGYKQVENIKEGQWEKTLLGFENLGAEMMGVYGAGKWLTASQGKPYSNIYKKFKEPSFNKNIANWQKGLTDKDWTYDKAYFDVLGQKTLYGKPISKEKIRWLTSDVKKGVYGMDISRYKVSGYETKFAQQHLKDMYSIKAIDWRYPKVIKITPKKMDTYGYRGILGTQPKSFTFEKPKIRNIVDIYTVDTSTQKLLMPKNIKITKYDRPYYLSKTTTTKPKKVVNVISGGDKTSTHKIIKTPKSSKIDWSGHVYADVTPQYTSASSMKGISLKINYVPITMAASGFASLIKSMVGVAPKLSQSQKISQSQVLSDKQQPALKQRAWSGTKVDTISDVVTKTKPKQLPRIKTIPKLTQPTKQIPITKPKPYPTIPIFPKPNYPKYKEDKWTTPKPLLLPKFKWPRGKFSPKAYKKKKFKPYHKYQPSLLAGFKKITTKEMPMPKYLTGVGIRPVIRF